MSECTARTLSGRKPVHNYSHRRGFGLGLAFKSPAQTLQAVSTGASMAEVSFPTTLGQAASSWQHQLLAVYF